MSDSIQSLQDQIRLLIYLKLSAIRIEAICMLMTCCINTVAFKFISQLTGVVIEQLCMGSEGALVPDDKHSTARPLLAC